MKKFKYICEYLLVVGIECFLTIFPRKIAYKIGENLGLLASIIFSKRNELAFNNIKKAFPEFSNQRVSSILRATWINIGRTAVEFVRFPKMNDELFKNKFILSDKDIGYVRQAQDKKRGIIFLMPHLTNWEVGGRAFSYWLRNVTVIARPMKNPYVEKWIQNKRSSSGLKIILHRKAVRESLRILNEKGYIGILPDQNLYKGGTFVKFFGRPAATTTLPALLYSRTKAPVILGYILREGEKIKIMGEPPIEFPEIADKKERIQKYTQIISDRVEGIIRKHPENWFWLHNRWKTQPSTKDESIHK